MKICTKVLQVVQKQNGFSILTDGVEIRLMFVTDSIVRIRAGFDGDFAEESYSLVMTAWEDRMDDFMKPYRRRVEPAKAVLTDEDSQAVIQGKLLKVVVEKEPFRICVYDQDPNRQGFRDALHIVNTILTHYGRNGIVGRRYEVQYPIQWVVPEEDTHPYYFAGMALKLAAPAIFKEVPET